MKNKKLTTCLCVAALTLAISGCSQSNAETINFNDFAAADNSGQRSDEFQNSGAQDTDEMKDESVQSEDNIRVQSSETENEIQPEGVSASDNDQPQSDEILDGDVESIGDNEVVINKTFYPSANEAVSYNDEKVLVNVNFSAETTFEVWTVKNGGANGDADVTKQEGSLSDIKIQSHLEMKGSYKGNNFNAAEVIIYIYL